MDQFLGGRSTALLKLFIKYGMVHKVHVITDSMTGRSKGFAFTAMDKGTASSSAIIELNGKEVLENGEFASKYRHHDSLHEDESPVVQSPVFYITEEASKALASLICNDPDRLNEIEWRDLERMLSFVFDGIGYAVRLTRPAKDGGKDMVIQFVASRENKSYYVEVKHWVSGKKVGKCNIKEFLSVVIQDHQQGGILIFTSGFSLGATQCITEIERKRIRFGNANTIVSLCRTYINVSRGLLYPVNFTDTIMAVTRNDIT